MAVDADDRARRFPLGSRVTLDGLSSDPYPILAELRAHEPVTWVPETGMWFVTRYDDVQHVLADFETYTVDVADSIIRDMFGRHMMTIDGPEQLRHKKQCMPMFRPKDLADTIGSGVGERVTRLIDDFIQDGEVELRFRVRPAPGGRDRHRDHRTPVGAGAADHVMVRAFRRIARELRPRPAHQISRTRRVGGVLRLVRSVLETIGPGDGDSLLNRLAHAHDRLTDEEIVSNALIIMFGGKSDDPELRGRAIVQAVTHWQDPAKLVEISRDLGEAMHGLEVGKLTPEEMLSRRGW